MGIGSTEILLMFLVAVLSSVVVVPPAWTVLTKAGYPGWWAVAALVPLGGIVLLWWFAFSDWPAMRRIAGRKS